MMKAGNAKFIITQRRVSKTFSQTIFEKSKSIRAPPLPFFSQSIWVGYGNPHPFWEMSYCTSTSSQRAFRLVPDFATIPRFASRRNTVSIRSATISLSGASPDGWRYAGAHKAAKNAGAGESLAVSAGRLARRLGIRRRPFRARRGRLNGSFQAALRFEPLYNNPLSQVC
jgi:hypothetical protein